MNVLHYSLFLLLLAPSITSANFTDVQPNHPNYEAIMWAKAEGIVQGYSDGSFKADNTINRAEFVKIIRRAQQKSIDEERSCFFFETKESFLTKHPLYDVDFESWYGKDLCYSLRAGWIQGYPDKTFRPSNEINFVEAAKIISNVLSPEPITLESSDVWYGPYVELLSSKGAIPRSITSLTKKITRGEMVEMLWRYKVKPNTFTSYSAEELNLVNTEKYEYVSKKHALRMSVPWHWSNTFNVDESYPSFAVSFGYGLPLAEDRDGQKIPLLNAHEASYQDVLNTIEHNYRTNFKYGNGTLLSDTDYGNGKRIVVIQNTGLCDNIRATVMQNKRALIISGQCLHLPLYKELIEQIAFYTTLE